MTVKWATARDVSATVKAVTCAGMCTTLQTQVLPLNLAHFFIYVTQISCISLQKVTLSFEKLVSNWKQFWIVHQNSSDDLITAYIWLHLSLTFQFGLCLEHSTTRGFLLPIHYTLTRTRIPVFPQFTISSLHIWAHSWSWCDCSCFSLSVTFELRKDWKLCAGYLQCKSLSPSPTQPWKAQVN